MSARSFYLSQSTSTGPPSPTVTAASADGSAPNGPANQVVHSFYARPTEAPSVLTPGASPVDPASPRGMGTPGHAAVQGCAAPAVVSSGMAAKDDRVRPFRGLGLELARRTKQRDTPVPGEASAAEAGSAREEEAATEPAAAAQLELGSLTSTLDKLPAWASASERDSRTGLNPDGTRETEFCSTFFFGSSLRGISPD